MGFIFCTVPVVLSGRLVVVVPLTGMGFTFNGDAGTSPKLKNK